MRKIRLVAVAVLAGMAVAPAPAQRGQPDAQIVAQAHDRCMVTHAVRLTRTAASDDDIYTQAVQSCLPLQEQLRAAVSAQLLGPLAGEILRAIDAQSRPNFFALIARIRNDRARRAAAE